MNNRHLPKVSAPSPLPVVDMMCVPSEHRSNFLNFHCRELDIIAALIASLGRTGLRMVEFGCQNGRTAKCLLHHFPQPVLERYIGVDVPPGFTTALPAQRSEVPLLAGELAFGDPRFVDLVRPRGSFDLMVSDLGPIDVAFIDGDHSRDGVMNDYLLSRSAMADGVIIFHDYNHDPAVQVAETLDELAASGEPIFHIENTWLAFQLVTPRGASRTSAGEQ